LQGALCANYAVEWATVACGRALNWVHDGNFLLLTAVRSGTTLMVDYLNCSRRIWCYGEILGRGHYQYGQPHRMSPERLRLHVESHFVKRPGLLVGAKIMTFHLDELPIKLADLIEMLGEPKIVVLYRRSIFEQYASLKLAERHGVWHVKGRPRDVRPIWIDPGDALAFAERERRMWRENFAAMESLQPHVLSYEDLTAEPAESMAGVFDYLEVTPATARSRYVKIDNKPLDQKLLNYHQLERLGVQEQMMLELPTQGSMVCAAAA
jgi:LPS sulfotransferase NodH